jgi:hypothetical protein
MKKDKQLVSRIILETLTRDGRSSILIRLKKQRLRDSTKNSASTSIDHSTLSHNFHSTELLRCSEELKWSSRDGERIQDNNNSGSMKSPRPSETTTGRTTALISKATEEAITLELLVSTQDGGNCSRKMENSLSMRKMAEP